MRRNHKTVVSLILMLLTTLVIQIPFTGRAVYATKDVSIISRCENQDVIGDIWNFNGSYGSDSADFIQGAASVYVTTNPTDNQAVMRRKTTQSPLDINIGNPWDKTLEFWIKISNTVDISEMQVELGTSIDLQEYSWSLSYLAAKGFIRPNEWIKMKLPFSEAGISGSPDNANLDTFGIYIITKTGKTTTFHIDNIEIARQESAALIPVAGNPVAIQSCDSFDSIGWTAQSVSPYVIDITDKKEGDAAWKFNYTNDGIFSFSTTTNLDKTFNLGDVTDKEVEFWMYINNPAKLGYMVLELSSSGLNDIDEYQWFMSGTQFLSGWNKVRLSFSSSSKSGLPNPNAINWVRAYYQVGGVSGIDQAVIKFDDIKVISKTILTTDASELAINRASGILSGFSGILTGNALRNQLDSHGEELRIVNASGNAVTVLNAGTGTRILLVNSAQSVVDSLTVVVYGDLSGDGVINIMDLARMKQHLLGKIPLTGASLTAADINRTGALTVSSVLAIKKHILGLRVIDQGPNVKPVMAPQITTPSVIQTLYPTQDAVVADYVVTNAPYGADNTGETDSTNAIQNAMNDCFNAGGGTVWVPGGIYKVTNTLNIPSFVTLRGDWRDPDSAGSDYGTVINAHVAGGDNGPVLFQIGGSAGVMGVTVYYPGQNATTPIPYNYTFSIPSSSYSGMPGTYMSSSVIDCTMINSYRGIGINALDNTKVHETSTVKNVKGTVLYRGVVAYNGADVGTWENITFNNSYWAGAGASFNAPPISSLNSWTRANGTAFTLGDLEWDQFYALDCSDYNIGIHIVAGSRMRFSGEFLYTNVRNSNTAVKVDAIDERWGSSFLRSNLSGSVKGILNSSGGYIKVCDSIITGGTSGTVSVSSPGTTPAGYTEGSPSKVSRMVLYDVTQAPYYAPHSAPQTGLPSADATLAIQNALNDAGGAGGGIVYLPAGWFRINTHLTVPANVELRGSSSVPQRDQGDLSYGTVLLGYEGKGTITPVSDTALVTLNGDTSGIRGIRFFYPENNPASGTISAYPFCIRGNGANQYVVNVAFSGVYNGVDFAMNRCDNHFIRKIVGVAYSRFIIVGSSTEGWIEGCLSNATAVCRNNFGIAGWVSDSTVFATVFEPQTRVNEILVVVYGSTNEHILNLFGYGCKFGVYVESGTADVFNLGTDNLGTGGFGIVRITGTARVMNYMRYNGADSSGSVLLFNPMHLYN